MPAIYTADNPPPDTSHVLTIIWKPTSGEGCATERRIDLFLRPQEADAIQFAFTGDWQAEAVARQRLFERHFVRAFEFLFGMGRRYA